MSVENSVIENNSRRERRLSELNCLKGLIKEKIPFELRKAYVKKYIEKGKPLIFGKGTDGESHFRVSSFKKDEDSTVCMVSAKEIDLRKYTSGYMVRMREYFSEEILHIIDVTDLKLSEEEIFNILDSEDSVEDRVVMVRDQQREYEEEMYDEFYYFLIEYDI